MPLLNEAAVLDEVLDSLREQDYPGDWELVAVDGGSVDGTVAILSTWRNEIAGLAVLTSPDRPRNLVESLNLGLETAQGDIVVRADAHTLYESDYLRRNVEALQQTGAVLVGGLMRPQGTHPFARAVAAVMTNRAVVGPAPYRRSESRRPADTVYLGAMRRQHLRRLGFQGFPGGVAEDADLAYRIRKEGGQVVLDPAIRSHYRPRSTPTRLWRQFYRYGQGKAAMLYVNRRFPSLRPLAPLTLVLGLGGLVAAAAILGRWWLPLAGAGAWLAYLGAVTMGRPLQWGAAAIIQLSNGIGLAAGLLRGSGAVRPQSVPRR